MEFDLLKITEIFMISCSFLVAAMGTADSNPHRAMVSILGLIVSVLWLACTLEETQGMPPADRPSRPRCKKILKWMPLLFILAWTIAAVIHLLRWNQPVPGA